NAATSSETSTLFLLMCGIKSGLYGYPPPRGAGQSPYFAGNIMRLAQFLFVLFVVGGLVGCDHATKHFATTHLQGSAPTELLPGILELLYTENHDMAFGLLDSFTTAEQRYPFLVLVKTLGFIVAVTALIVRFGRSGWVEKLGVTAIAAGA